MELVYLWVEEYKNIEQQGFNFSPRFECSYDGENLTIDDKSKDYVSIFPDKINITAIVGENGSGKSRILEALYLMPENEGKNLFYVYTIDGKTFYYETNSGFSLNSTSTIIQNYSTEISYLGLSFIPNLQKNIFSAKKSEDTPSYTENYKMEFIYKFIEVFKKNNQVLKNIDDKFVFDKLKITIHREKLLPKSELNIAQGLASTVTKLPYEEYKSFLKKTYTRIEKLIAEVLPCSEPNGRAQILTLPLTIKKSSGDLIQDIKISFLILYMNHLVSLFSNIENINRTNFDSASYLFDDLSFENLFEKIKEFENNINLHGIHLKDIQNNIKLVEEWIKFSEEHRTSFIETKDAFSLCLDLDEDLINEILNFKTLFHIDAEFNTFTFLNIELLSYEGEVDFFGLSSGEQKRLSLYIEIIHSYFFSERKILLLDEPDTFLHPQWSKIFINDLLKALPKETEKKHLVLTSHSPFILSDLPKENVIFLKDGAPDNTDIQQTFGANIHTLLSHGFFMKDGLMGEFAKEQINEVIKLLNPNSKRKLSQKNQKFCENIISIIGEPLLQKTLEHQLNEKLNSNETELQRLQREQKEIQEKIAELTKNSHETD